MKTIKKWIPVVLSAMAFVVVLIYLQPAPAVQVVVAARDLPAGHNMSLEDVKLEEIPEHLVPQQALTNPGEVLEQTLSMDRAQGDLLTAAHFGERVTLGAGERAVAISVEDASGLAGLIQPGDRVGINAVIYAEDYSVHGAFSKATLENLRVLYISPEFEAQDPAPQVLDEETDATTASLMQLGLQPERETKGTLVLAASINETVVRYNHGDHYANLEDVEVTVTPLELLSALENADNARLSVYLMPQQPEPLVSSGVWVPDLVVTPAFTPTPTLTPTLDPFTQGQAYSATPAPTLTPLTTGE